MSTALVVSGVVRSVGVDDAGRDVFDVAITDDHYKAQRQRAAAKWGAGVEIVIRIEPKDESAKYHQFKYLFGYVFTCVSARTGETVADVEMRMKTSYMPDDGRTSLTQLNEAEIKAFTESCEQDARENTPAAWDDIVAKSSLYEQRKVG